MTTILILLAVANHAFGIYLTRTVWYPIYHQGFTKHNVITAIAMVVFSFFLPFCAALFWVYFRFVENKLKRPT